MSPPDPKVIVGRFFQAAINEREFAALDDLLDPDFALHSSVLGDVRGATAFKDSAHALVKPCPDLQPHSAYQTDRFLIDGPGTPRAPHERRLMTASGE